MAFAKEAGPKSGEPMMEMAAVDLKCATDPKFVAAMQAAARKQMMWR